MAFQCASFAVVPAIRLEIAAVVVYSIWTPVE